MFKKIKYQLTNLIFRFNEFAKQTSGEASKGAQTRALLFDISFLMLCHIMQLYGTEVSHLDISLFSVYVANVQNQLRNLLLLLLYLRNDNKIYRTMSRE